MVRVISIDGNIGSGKSTFVNILKMYYQDPNNCNGLKICFLQEPVDLWNEITDTNGKTIIECFYQDQKTYGFSFQMMAYISRLSILKNALKNDYDIIFTERCLYTDKNVFCKMLYDDRIISEIDYKIYNKWFDEFLEDIPEIEYIYIKTYPQIVFDRIVERGRPGEIIPIEYLQKCDNYHNSWLLNKCLIIDGNVDIKKSPDIIPEWNKQIANYIDICILSFCGVSRDNNICGVSFAIHKSNNQVHSEKHCVSQKNTQIYAELCALYIALKKVIQLGDRNLVIKTTSNEIINLSTEYKNTNKITSIDIKNGNNKEIINMIILELDKLHYYTFIYNKDSDNINNLISLANLAINRYGKQAMRV